MSKKVQVIGVVERVMKSNGKPTKMVVSIPAEDASSIPMGEVSMEIEAVQSELELPRSGKKPVRGDHG